MLHIISQYDWLAVKHYYLQYPFYVQFIHGHRKSSIKRKTREELLKVTQEQLFLELIRDIAEELDVNSLCHKILINVIVLVSSGISIFPEL